MIRMTTPGRPPLPSGGAHAAQGDRRRRVSRWAPNCPPNTNCASDSRSAATPCARRCAGCAKTTWSSSRPRAGTWWFRAPASNSYAQDVMSINDLLAFAAGAQFDIESNAMVTIDDDLAARTGLAVGERVAGGARLPAGRRAPSAGVPNRVLHQPRVRRGGPAAATPHRPDLPADRGPVRGEHRRGAPGDLRGADVAPSWQTACEVEPGTPALEMRRTYTTSDGEIAQVTINTHPASRFRHAMTMRRVKG